ncbi:MAG: molybdenum cofactor biosynthesis protein [Solirubrobacteraceae bacterium]
MRVSVRLFAVLRERAGAGELELELPEGALVRDALARVDGLASDVPVVMAVNRNYAARDAVLHAGDELALIPPVSGGSGRTEESAQWGGSPHVRVTREPLALDPLLQRVRHPAAGALVTFLGVTREVELLEYEAYAEMAELQMAEIVGQAIDRHGLCSAAAEHRIGVVLLSEPSVAVAVSAAHRGPAFAGAREIIDQIKARAPIWKKEQGEWVRGVTPGATG